MFQGMPKIQDLKIQDFAAPHKHLRPMQIHSAPPPTITTTGVGRVKPAKLGNPRWTSENTLANF
jgi:hypothetical protein